ncbi:MAG: hypothetical protein HY267_01300 [Deltaproteobacteria bacterium]|nr:hypothetical protein [Deltaproteobacteria bacterium]
MTQLLYTMQFKGKAALANDAGTVLKATTTAPSCTISTVVGDAGVTGHLQPINGGQASFESQVTFTGETSFQEVGSLTFGDKGHRLYFSTVGQGHIGPSTDPQLKHGSVMWKVERGEGQFVGTTGLITSNFFVSESGEVTDNHFGVIFIK